ncbi:cytoskeleton-associated protein 4 [Synchiropus splendidus]|uniref:cytoskeleton-associated protein 4 n=1 Tax=Synchiropus splendidus TaxID=270530 RepID=UPI00237E8D11|nr:cytoskeleton-associated protein 4 [Synchiropus splendidus]
MAAKNRQKSEKGEKSASNHEDAPKKSQKSNGASSAGPQGPRSPQKPAATGCLRSLASALLYAVLAAAVGFAALYCQKVLEEVREASARTEESARRSGQLRGAVDGVQLQVESLKRLVEGLESSLSITRSELEGAVSRMKAGELETKKVDETVRNLQSDLLADLSESIKEVKVAQESDLSTVERSVEQRLAEVSEALKASVAEVTSAHAEVQQQVAGLQALVGGAENPALLRQELEAIVNTVAEIKAAQGAEDSRAGSLREQIGSVREELQTRNREVASLSDEVQSVRALVQEAAGSLKRSLSEAQLDLQALKDQRETLESELEQALSRAQEAQKQASEAAAQAQGRSEELETRVKASEESADSLAASISDITYKVDSLLGKAGTLESSVAEQGRAADDAKVTLGGELALLRGRLDQLQSTQESSAWEEPLEELRKRVVSQEESGQRALQSLLSKLSELEEKTSARLQSQEQAISSLQEGVSSSSSSRAEE